MTANVEQAIAAIAGGDFVVVTDDANRENEGDLVLAAEAATPEAIAFMVRHTSGVICVPLVGSRLDELQLPLMVRENTDSLRTAFTVSVDSVGTTTGISARDRATTIRALISADAKPADFIRPGHVFPLRYTEGGVLKRQGHTEAAVDLARLAGLFPAGVLCEIVNQDGSMARGEELTQFAQQHRLALVSIGELIRYRSRTERLVSQFSEARLPTRYAEFTVLGYEASLDGSRHLALVLGEVRGSEPVLVRMHSECVTGDVFGSLRCDCGEQLDAALVAIAAEGSGVLIYSGGHEGRGIGLLSKLSAYALQDAGMDTVDANLALGLPADDRSYLVGAQILADLGVERVRLLSNNPAKISALNDFGFKAVERVPLLIPPNQANQNYLRAKAERLGHLIPESGKDG